MISEEREKEIRNRVKKRFDKRAEFFTHLFSFLVFTAAQWLIIMPTIVADNGFFRLIGTLITIGWTIGIVTHGTQYFMFELGEQAAEREIEKERELYYLALAEKPKNSPAKRLMTVGEDGELEFEDEPPQRARKA